MSWKKVELIEGEPVVFVGVYALRWRAEWGEPSVGFVPDDDSEVNALSARLAIAVEALGAIDDFDFMAENFEGTRILDNTDYERKYFDFKDAARTALEKIKGEPNA